MSHSPTPSDISPSTRNTRFTITSMYFKNFAPDPNPIGSFCARWLPCAGLESPWLEARLPTMDQLWDSLTMMIMEDGNQISIPILQSGILQKRKRIVNWFLLLERGWNSFHLCFKTIWFCLCGLGGYLYLTVTIFVLGDDFAKAGWSSLPPKITTTDTTTPSIPSTS